MLVHLGQKAIVVFVVWHHFQAKDSSIHYENLLSFQRPEQPLHTENHKANDTRKLFSPIYNSTTFTRHRRKVRMIHVIYLL